MYLRALFIYSIFIIFEADYHKIMCHKSAFLLPARRSAATKARAKMGSEHAADNSSTHATLSAATACSSINSRGSSTEREKKGFCFHLK